MINFNFATVPKLLFESYNLQQFHNFLFVNYNFATILQQFFILLNVFVNFNFATVWNLLICKLQLLLHHFLYFNL